MDVLTLEEAVNLYGNDKQKKSFVSRGGNLVPKPFNALIRTIEQHYSIVTVEGKGRKRIIYCDGKYDEPVERKDLRKGNGKVVPYDYEMFSLVLDYVLNNCQNKVVNMSLTQWLSKIGLIDWKIIKAANNKEIMRIHLRLLEEEYPNRFSKKDIAMVDHFIKKELRRLKDNLLSVIHRMAKNKIIIHTKTLHACMDNGIHKKLSDKEIKEVADHKKMLCDIHNITLNQIMFGFKNERTDAYEKDFKHFLKKKGIRYIYESHGVFVQVPTKRINEYLDKLNENDELVFSYGLSEDNIAIMLRDFKKYYTKNSLSLAEERQLKAYKSDHDRIKELKEVKSYINMWELLLIFYEMTNHVKPTYIDHTDVEEVLCNDFENF